MAMHCVRSLVSFTGGGCPLPFAEAGPRGDESTCHAAGASGICSRKGTENEICSSRNCTASSNNLGFAASDPIYDHAAVLMA